MCKISVILLSESNESFENSLKSILSQTITDIEIYCLIDSIETLDIINKYTQKSNIHTVFKSINVGKTLNECLNYIQGTYVYFMTDNILLTDNDALMKLYDEGIRTNSSMIGANPHISQTIPTQEYDFNLPLHNNIYLSSFLREHNITFPEITFNADYVVLSQILRNTKSITQLNIDFYEEKNNTLIHTNKKYNYQKDEQITQFITTFNILNDSNLQKQLEQYKRKFLELLKHGNKLNDHNLTKILEKKSELDKYFNKQDYGYFYIDYIKNPVEENEEYQLVKECIFEQNMLENEYIDIQTLQDLIKLKEKTDTNTRVKNSYKQLLEIEKYTENDKKEAVQSRNNVKKELVHNVSIKNAIFSSNSWKLTNYLRVLKLKIKPVKRND